MDSEAGRRGGGLGESVTSDQAGKKAVGKSGGGRAWARGRAHMAPLVGRALLGELSRLKEVGE